MGKSSRCNARYKLNNTARRLGGGASENNLDPTQVENEVPQEASIRVPQEAPRDEHVDLVSPSLT